MSDFTSSKSEFSQLVPETSNSAFSVSYAESSLTSNFELNAAILDFGRFEVSKNPIFHKSSWRPEMVLFVLVTVKAALPANLSSIRGGEILADLRSGKIRFFTAPPGRPHMVRFVLVFLRAA